jgi:hypothetical protein
MDAQQIAAMHVFKHEMLAAFHRVYLTVPAEFANPLIKKFIANLPRITAAEDDTNPSE